MNDESQVGAMLRDVLGELGYIVKVAVRGAEALKLVPVFEPDVVLLDLMMPEMSGVEVLDHLRRDRPTLRVVMLTANEDVEVARATLRAMKAGSARTRRAHTAAGSRGRGWR